MLKSTPMANGWMQPIIYLCLVSPLLKFQVQPKSKLANDPFGFDMLLKFLDNNNNFPFEGKIYGFNS